ncbi:OLC1v1000189C2 [Oldenlandia corymbosa var. corymbosa]|uniref:OLC1v1000189C2 n=1 Tax=Oldenlandia corymbosa var. corymbosa TaxID=529605 RepID=A0AAV1D3S6_OLDCO|nr:OLC1v1000189C2 [Oldenlandia corymbosa var. corymbosa]
MGLSILLLLLLLLPVFIFLILQRKNHTKNPSKKVIPGPPGLPLIGNLHQFDNSAPHKYLWKLSQKYGEVLSLKLGSLPVVVFSSARMAEEVMKNHDMVFCSRPPMVGFRKMSYNSSDIALAPYNEEWKEMRKLCVAHLLSIKRVQSFRPVREDELSRMIGKISREASELRLTNLSETIMTFASTMICRIAFGKRYDEKDHQRRRFNYLLREAQAVFALFYFSDFFPRIGWLDHYTGTFSRLEKIFKELDAFYEELIDEHMDRKTRPKSMEGDIIDIMLELRQGNSSSSPVQLTMDHIKAMLMNVFFAGTDTSAGTITWAMTMLMKNPNVMQKAQAEIREVIVGKHEKKLSIDEDDLEKLPYVKAIVKETLRLYSPVPLLLPRYTMENCTIDGYEIPRNTLVYVNGWAIARDPKYYENPHEFFPDRFLEGKNHKIDITGQEFELIPFGSGRRICPGSSMGLLTVELTLANLLHSFNWELPQGMKKEDIDTEGSTGVSVLKKNDLLLVAKPVCA